VTGFPYEVQFGHCCNQKAAFASFELALAFYRGYERAQVAHWNNNSARTDDGPRIVNVDNIDGADDAGEAAQHGLTAAEWEQLQDRE